MLVLADIPIWLSLLTSLGPAFIGAFSGALVGWLVQRTTHRRTRTETKRDALCKAYQVIKRLVATCESAHLNFRFELNSVVNREELWDTIKRNLVIIDQALLEARTAASAYLFVDDEDAVGNGIAVVHSSFLLWQQCIVEKCNHRLEPDRFKDEPTDEEIREVSSFARENRDKLLEVAKSWEKKLS